MSEIKLTARDSGPYVVYVDDVEYSRHTTEREAVENVTEVLAASPGARVHYSHDYTVDAVLVDAPEAPEDPEDPPVEDPEDPEDPPVEDPPVEDPPVEDPPVDPGPGPNPTLHPNEPAGFTPLYDNPGTFKLGPMWDDNWYNGQSEVVDDPQNPTGSGKAIRATHPAGRGGPAAKLASWGDLGTTLGGKGAPRTGWRELYLSHRRTYEAAFPPCQPHANGDRGLKLFYLGMHPSAVQGGNTNKIYLTGCTNQSFTVQPGGGGTTRDWFLNPGWPPPAPLADWHLEMHLIAESASRGDGEAYIYSNGSLVQHITGIAFSDPTRPGTFFDGMEMYHTAEPAASLEAWLEREWYVSGR
jgi:hypothetical protein